MKKLFAVLIASVLFALPLAGIAAPDESQKALIQGGGMGMQGMQGMGKK